MLSNAEVVWLGIVVNKYSTTDVNSFRTADYLRPSLDAKNFAKEQ
jgi:hypothetical protein